MIDRKLLQEVFAIVIQNDLTGVNTAAMTTADVQARRKEVRDSFSQNAVYQDRIEFGVPRRRERARE